MQGLLEPLDVDHVLGEFESLALSLNGELTDWEENQWMNRVTLVGTMDWEKYLF